MFLPAEENIRVYRMKERLTMRNSDGSVSQYARLNWADVLYKLAAYEDCGLSPKEVQEMVDKNKEVKNE